MMKAKPGFILMLLGLAATYAVMVKTTMDMMLQGR